MSLWIMADHLVCENRIYTQCYIATVYECCVHVALPWLAHLLRVIVVVDVVSWFGVCSICKFIFVRYVQRHSSWPCQINWFNNNNSEHNYNSLKNIKFKCNTRVDSDKEVKESRKHTEHIITIVTILRTLRRIIIWIAARRSTRHTWATACV